MRKWKCYGTCRPSKRESTVCGTSKPRGFNKNAMALLSQSRDNWPSMAPLGHVEFTKMQKLSKSKSKNQNENEKQNENNDENSFSFSFSFLVFVFICVLVFIFVIVFIFVFAFVFVLFVLVLFLNFTMASLGHYRCHCSRKEKLIKSLLAFVLLMLQIVLKQR